jgi:hypothetical protein
MQSSESNNKREDCVMFTPTVRNCKDSIVMSSSCDLASVLCRIDSTYSLLLAQPLFFDASTNIRSQVPCAHTLSRQFRVRSFNSPSDPMS